MFGNWFLLVPVLLPLLSGLLLTLYKPLGDGKGRNPLVLTVLCLNVVALLPVLLGGDKELTLFTLSDTLPVMLRIDDTAAGSAPSWPLYGPLRARILSNIWRTRKTCAATTASI